MAKNLLYKVFDWTANMYSCFCLLKLISLSAVKKCSINFQCYCVCVSNRDQWVCSCYWNWSQSWPRTHVHSSWRHQCSVASQLETLVINMSADFWLSVLSCIWMIYCITDCYLYPKAAGNLLFRVFVFLCNFVMLSVTNTTWKWLQLSPWNFPTGLERAVWSL